ncbi:uncharacterized protein [Ambystoma mexicanum]|uniref:uncharacterized protein n=1 Tax=Ambystoma mexicanum TaxID=8296 RepID=UPI0037E79434
MNDVLRELIDICALVYIDDILVYSASKQDHVKHVRSVLAKLCQHHLYAKLEKCLFHVTEVEFLSFILTPKGIQMDAHKVDAILNWPAPNSFKGIQSNLGFANFFRRFILGFSQIVHPITSLLRKCNKKFQWTEETEKAFQELKVRFTSAPILRHPRLDVSYVVETEPPVWQWAQFFCKGIHKPANCTR